MSTPDYDPAQMLKDLKPTRDFFIGIDSDGCVFDTMEIKHKECFIPNFINVFGLQSVSKYARETWEFVNLYSTSRGCNRFPAAILTLDLLRERVEVKARGAVIPAMNGLREWLRHETKLANPALKRALDASGDADLALTYEWSLAVNESVARMVRGVPPFPLVRESLVDMSGKADMIVLSQTPVEALRREWEEHDIDSFARIIGGQEMGSKTEQLGIAAKGQYPEDRILMVGDAPGDLEAARKNGALFYAINPGHEEASWRRLHEEALGRFFSASYAGSYENSIIEEFQRYLPESPPWKL
ncbi:MAG: HAD family hydrolase [Spirochaetia bacterium]|nr:HAD family hydrolase [Spirochaetia bacterium]